MNPEHATFWIVGAAVLSVLCGLTFWGVLRTRRQRIAAIAWPFIALLFLLPLHGRLVIDPTVDEYFAAQWEQDKPPIGFRTRWLTERAASVDDDGHICRAHWADGATLILDRTESTNLWVHYEARPYFGFVLRGGSPEKTSLLSQNGCKP